MNFDDLPHHSYSDRGLLFLIETARGPDRELDRKIAERLGEPFGAWGYADEEGEIAAPYTGSLDVACAIRPADWYWQAGRTSSFRGWARCYEMHPDHTDPGVNEFGTKEAATPELALCYAALAARLSERGVMAARGMPDDEVTSK